MRRNQLLLCLTFCSLCLIVTPIHAAPHTLEVAIYEEVPYQFVEDNGQITGLLVDLFNEVAELANYQVEYHCYNSIRECVAALEDRKIDLVLGMPCANNFELSETAELYASPLVIAGNSTYVNQHDRPDGYNRYTAGYGYYATGQEIIYSMGANHYIIADRGYGLINLLAEQKIDVAILDKAVLDYVMAGEYQNLDIKITNSYLDTVKYTVACAPENSSLLRALNTAILDLRIGGNYNEIKTKWIAEESGTDWQRWMRYAIAAAGILLVAFGVYFMVNRRIQRLLESEIQEKTQGIQHVNAQLESQVKQLQFEGELRNKLIKTAHNGMAMVDREGRIQLMNQSANRMAGFPARVEGMLVTQLPCFREVLAQVEGDIFEPNFSVDNRQITVQAKEDEPAAVFRLNIQQIVELGQVTGALITLENITDEQRMIRASYEEEKNHALNRIIAGIVHEIKNPLMSIRTYASLISQKMNDVAFQESFAEFVPREADRINDLVESLASYARPARGTKSRVDLCRLVQECAYLSRVAKRKVPIEVTIQADGQVYIYANPDQIKQVVINMMINGIEAIEEKYSVFQGQDDSFLLSVSVEQGERQVLLTVSDNGIGMSREGRQQCTNLFYTTKHHGTGLGLALSDQFIRENDGWLEIVSREGEFTRFMIYFPPATAITC